jgi:hypothetical protein
MRALLILLFCATIIEGQPNSLPDPPQLGKGWIEILSDFKQALGASPDAATAKSLRETVAATLDTLIQRGIPIPDEVSLSWLPEFPAQVVILLYGKRCPKLSTSVEILSKAIADEVWLAAAACLAKQPGGPVELLQRIRVKARIEVFDVERERGVPGGKPGGIIGGIIGLPEIFYRLATDQVAQPGYTLLIGGKHPVYYTRTTWDWSPSICKWDCADRNQYALDLLASNAPSRFDRPLEPVTSVRLRWVNSEQGRTDLQALAADLRQRYADMLRGLMLLHLLTAEERDRCPRSVDIEVRDDRGNMDQPLPMSVIANDIR